MLELKLRRALVYGTTGVFFLVAATAQLQGASVGETALKAGVACVVMTVIGVALLNTIGGALRAGMTDHKPTNKAERASSAARDETQAAAAGGEA